MSARLHWAPGNAICYSGYRRGQSPDTQTYPSLAEIREDLALLAPHWRYLRLYDCSLHAQRVLQVIAEDGLDFQVMLGAYLAAEQSNPACPWGGMHSDAVLAANARANQAELARLVQLAQAYAQTVFSVAVGNEATVDWTDHWVPVAQMVQYVRWVQARVAQPVTFCENYVPWQGALHALAEVVDFISLHSYPVWEYQTVHQALAYTQANWHSVASRYPGKPVVITEAGWATQSNGRGIPPDHVSPQLQAQYCGELLQWARDSGLLVFVFEAFDEPWKGSPDPLEPEKHWGLYDVDRRPKPAAQALWAAQPA